MVLARILSITGASYTKSILIGFLTAGLIYAGVAGLNQHYQYDLQALCLTVAFGSLMGGLVTFISRLVFDRLARYS